LGIGPSEAVLEIDAYSGITSHAGGSATVRETVALHVSS